MKTTVSHWEGNSPYTALAKALDKLVPIMGAVKDPRKNRKLERYRKATNCYYDLYNNGLGNRCSEFTKVFGIRGSDVRDFVNSREGYHEETERILNDIILEASTEQIKVLSGLVNVD